jgi:hypothetical protein
MRALIPIVLASTLVAAGCQRQPAGSQSASTGAQATPAQPAQPASATAWSLEVTAVPSPAPAQSLGPQFTTSSKGAILSWLERHGDATTLKFAERTASGWAPPVTVASGKDWFISNADVPSVFRAANGTLVANWLPETDATIEAYNLLLSYSRDNGKTWARAFSPHHDKTTTQHGFASFYDLPNNGVGLVWLDGRQQELDTTSPEGGAMSLRAAAFDATWKQTGEDAVDLRVCECCPTTTTVTADGPLVAYRDRSDKDVRDIRVSRLENGKWNEGPIVHQDGWTIPACPVNGPALSADGKTVAIAWYTAKDEQGHAYAAFSSDSGSSWSAPIRLDDANALGHVDIALLDDGSAAASWVEFANQRAEFKARRIDASGMKSAAVSVAVRPVGVPRLARVGDELLFAWTEGTAEASQMKTAVARVPRATAVR